MSGTQQIPREAFGGLLSGEQAFLTAGVGLFEASLESQGVRQTRVDWRPPVDGSQAALAAIAADPRTAAANREAVGRLMSARPHWVDVQPAREALAGLGARTFLHAGPPIDWASASGPLRGALIGGILYEGLADSPEQAARLAQRGEIELAPCHHHDAVGPMAGVVTPTMPVFVVHDHEHGRTACCTLNEGLGKVLRYGAFSSEVIERLRWLERVLAPALRDTVRRHGPLDISALVAQALQMGDELHNRNRAATSLFLREVVADLVEGERPSSETAGAVRFINGNDHFFLNLVMPACKAADAARDIGGSTMIVAMARNGTEFGIRTAGTGDQWFTGPAGVPDGLFLGGYSRDDANPDIGDSTITETAGIGGFAMAAAPAIVRFVGGAVGDALRHTQAMYEITLAENDAYQIPILEFRGTPTGIDVTRVARTGILPVVNTGIAGREPGTGQVGAGLVSPPLNAFVDALKALGGAAQRAA